MTVKATRHPKTPAQRAQEQVDILQRRLAKIGIQKIALEHQVHDITTQFDVTQKRLTYALGNPDLPAKPTTAPRPISPPPA
jgi:hypothetical protein